MPSPIALAQSIFQGFAVNSGMEMLGGAQRAVSYAANRALPNNSLGYDAYIKLFQAGLLDAVGLQDNLYHLGFEITQLPQPRFRLIQANAAGVLELRTELWKGDYTDVDRAVAISKNIPSPDEVLLLLNRGLVTKELALWLIKFAFGGEAALANTWLSLADQIPGPSDLVSFAVRDVWSPDIVSTFQYNKELPSAILPWMAKQGLAAKIGIPLPAGSTNTEGPDPRSEAQWFDAYWWAHWQLPSVGQGNEMLQRLYADSLHGPSPYASADTFFTPENLELLQKANDFPPFWRKRLQAISYTPLGRIDIKRMYAIGVLKEDDVNHDVFHAFRQNGYNDKDAALLTRYVIVSARKDIKDLTVKEIDKAYNLGVLDDNAAIELLKVLFYTDSEATQHVNNLKLELRNEEISELLKYAKKAFLTGDFNQDALVQLFNRMGLQQWAQDRYLRLWGSERTASPRHISAGQAVKAYKQGLVTVDALQNRLRVLKYPENEVQLIVETANHEVAITQAKALLLAAKQQTAKVQKAAQQAVKDAKASAKEKVKTAESLTKQVEKLSAADKKAFTEPNIKAFYKGGFINEAEVRNILQAKGWLANTIDVWMETFTPPKQKKA